jgi:hypothetical protein
MIVALVLSFLFFGGSSSMLALQGHSPAEVEKALKHVVVEDNRKKSALDEVDLWKKALKGQDEKADKDQKALLKALKRHDATRAEVDQIDAKLDETFHEMDRSFLDTRFRLKQSLTKEEWSALSLQSSRR